MSKVAIATMVLLAGLGVSLSFGAEPYTYVSLDRDGSELKTSFNADSGKVRVVMLVAPT